MPPHENFFDSNRFIAFITLLVGLFGFVLYYLRGSDYKRRAAKIIYLEVTNAEEQLRDASNRLHESNKAGKKTLPEHLYVMPSDTWTSNKHLFVDNFKTNEWTALNTFYAQCQLFDEAIRINDSRFSKDEQQLRQNVQRASYDYAVKMFKHLDKSDMDAASAEKAVQDSLKERDVFASFITTSQNMYVYTPIKQMQDVELIISKIQLGLSLSSVGTKLEKLSKRRFLIVKR